MKYITTISAAALVCSFTFGCSKPAEPPKPDPTKAPPAPPAASAPAAGPTLPVPTGGPTLPGPTPPGATASVTGPALTPPPGGPELPKPGAAAATTVPAFAKRPAADDLKAVQEAIAKQMKIKPEDVKPTATLAELKMSALDYPDAVDALERKLNITISKVALQKASGADMPYDVIEKLTVQKLADTINAIPPKQ
jgi:acyl carrier protein